MSATALKSAELIFDVTQFVYREARLQDEHEYSEWEKLWDSDGIYWLPANGDDIDPETQMSIIYDNRSRISVRVNQLNTGKRHSQLPRSSLRRVISNIELLDGQDDCIVVGANSLIFESGSRGDVLWGGRITYKLRRHADGFRMALKKVALVNNSTPLLTMAFLV